MPDATYQTSNYEKQGGKEWVIGGLLTIDGGTLQTGAGNDLGILKRYMHKQVADLSAEATYYLTSTYAGKITKLMSIVDGAVGTADATATFSINGTPITTGVVTMPTSGSAAGNQASAVPTGANTVAVGDVISFVVTGGGSGGTPRADFYVEITAQ